MDEPGERGRREPPETGAGRTPGPGDGAPGADAAGDGAVGGGAAGDGAVGDEAEVEYAEHAERAEDAEHAEFAEYAEHAEYAEYAEHMIHGLSAGPPPGLAPAPGGKAQAEAAGPATEAAGGPAEAVAGPAPEAGPGPARPGHMHAPHLHHAGPDGLTDEPWRGELVKLMQAATRLQEAGARRLSRPDRPEPRWPVTLTVIVAIALQLVLRPDLGLGPRYVLPALEGALLVGLSIANPVRIERHSRPIRAASIALIVLITAANAISAGLLIREIVSGTVPGGANAAVNLLISGGAVWGTNVIAFALWYWEFDRGGPVLRLDMINPHPDLLFPQMTAPELTPSGWGPRFTDYLYVSFTNATAFSPTDTMPLARWAKMTMLVQSAVSLAVGALVVARAVNILH